MQLMCSEVLSMSQTKTYALFIIFLLLVSKILEKLAAHVFKNHFCSSNFYASIYECSTFSEN